MKTIIEKKEDGIHITCGDTELSEVHGELCFLEQDGENVAWTKQQCDEIFQVLRAREGVLYDIQNPKS